MSYVENDVVVGLLFHGAPPRRCGHNRKNNSVRFTSQTVNKCLWRQCSPEDRVIYTSREIIYVTRKGSPVLSTIARNFSDDDEDRLGLVQLIGVDNLASPAYER